MDASLALSWNDGDDPKCGKNEPRATNRNKNHPGSGRQMHWQRWNDVSKVWGLTLDQINFNKNDAKASSIEEYFKLADWKLIRKTSSIRSGGSWEVASEARTWSAYHMMQFQTSEVLFTKCCRKKTYRILRTQRAIIAFKRLSTL